MPIPVANSKKPHGMAGSLPQKKQAAKASSNQPINIAVLRKVFPPPFVICYNNLRRKKYNRSAYNFSASRRAIISNPASFGCTATGSKNFASWSMSSGPSTREIAGSAISLTASRNACR